MTTVSKAPVSFDIETRPRPEPELRVLCPDVDESKFEPTEFDPGSVKIGNIKNPQLIADKVDAAMQRHATEMANLSGKLADAREENWQSFLTASTLDAAFSEVCCIGYYSLRHPESFTVDAVWDESPDETIRTEADILKRFWSQSEAVIRQGRCLVGVNILNFDLPYMWRRSCVNKVSVPPLLYSERMKKWPKWNDKFIDLGNVWRSTTPPTSCKWGFNALAAAFGSGGKVTDGEIKGGDFWKFWDGSDEDRCMALAYLEADVKQPASWANSLNVR